MLVGDGRGARHAAVGSFADTDVQVTSGDTEKLVAISLVSPIALFSSGALWLNLSNSPVSYSDRGFVR